jgi:hypothetical protein
VGLSQLSGPGTAKTPLARIAIGKLALGADCGLLQYIR